ncbi:LysR family transcriptional regulator [Brochothrix thermosphacta]|uniref:LysR family transcriptional regulator n=1 Tax=Brochothrix thermosphacta TaxID=2756 RepID=A0A1D2KJQ2_BROTH|nr:LysR family transcriptional regulator [Brochothrix thermosphacta]SLM97623.1 LysR family transcriptional regulator YeiE [Brachybacterium faecium]ATF25921.1 LysR family transcriptional regulator [Brochothrix thermosphacta]ATH85262.1 LysR family transcriptional regulator [Brochothrix thermosphacta]MPQ28632.1 LysR family transcriptional regulator [Brochothrix thermosphacta]ODJ50687.1 hypothetical protein BFR40_09185 [Brochothrix thermosphacta]
MLSLLHTYVTVYELRNFSKAAEMLYLSQPTVSVHIQKLEEMTDTPLFIRNEKKGVEPTEFGEMFYIKALNLIKDWGSTLDEIKQKKTNRKHYTILISHSIAEMYFNNFIPSLILTFSEFDFDFLVKNSEEIIHAITNEKNVIGLIEKPTNRSDFNETILLEDQMVHVGSQDSPYWIEREENSGMRFYQELYLDQKKLHLHTITTNSLSFLVKLLENNIGQTLVSKKALDYLPQSIDWKDTQFKRHLTLIQKTEPLKNSDAGKLTTFLKTQIKKQQP